MVYEKTAKELANEAKAKVKAEEVAAKATKLADAYVEKPRLNLTLSGKLS